MNNTATPIYDENGVLTNFEDFNRFELINIFENHYINDDFFKDKNQIFHLFTKQGLNIWNKYDYKVPKLGEYQIAYIEAIFNHAIFGLTSLVMNFEAEKENEVNATVYQFKLNQYICGLSRNFLYEIPSEHKEKCKLAIIPENFKREDIGKEYIFEIEIYEKGSTIISCFTKDFLNEILTNWTPRLIWLHKILKENKNLEL